MSVGIGRISKGLFQQAIERVANNEQLRPDFLATLKGTPAISGTDWIDFLRDSGGLDRAAERYVRDQWLQFWPSYPVEALLRQSLIEAIELANTHNPDPKNLLPIECHWIWTNYNNKFEVLVTYNTRQVTRILLTPPPPTNSALPLRALAPYFIIKPRGDVDPEQEQELPRDPEAPWATVQLKAAH